MIRIAVCDDNINELAGISALLDQYKTEMNAAFTYDVFLSAIELLEAIKRKAYHILLLDVLMPGTTGMQAAHEIRSFDSSVKIIFLTASSDYAVESYDVNAHYYLLKPATAQKFFPVLNRIFIDDQKSQDTLCLQSSSGYMRLQFGYIESLEVLNKKLFFHLADGSVKSINGSLSDFEDIFLSRDEFVKVHRSYIVNLAYIKSLNAGGLSTYSGQTVPISRRLYSKIRESYMQHLFVEKQVE